MNINKGFSLYSRVLRKPEDGGGSGGDANGSSASSTTGADGKTVTVGQVADASAAANSGKASIPFAQGDPAGGQPDWRTGWDDTLKNDPALKDFKTPADLAKSFVETKKMVGQKSGIPGKDATPEQKAEFHKAMGVPDGPEGYEFKKPDNLPPALAEAYSEEDALAWAKDMKELGVPKDVANALRDKFIAQQVAAVGTMKEDVGKSDADFDKVMLDTFGDKKDAQIQSARAIVEKHVPANLKPYLADLPNSALAVVAAAMNGVRAEYGGEDRVIQGDEGGSAKSEAQLRQELRETMSLPEWSNPFAKGKERHEEVKNQATQLSNQIAALKKEPAKK